jgi:hypothetical protein
MPTKESPYVRRAFTRYRLGGVASAVVSRAWLRVLGPSGGAPQILDPIAQQNRTLAAFIRLQSSFDVKVADILKETASGRIFVVGQVQPEPGRTNLLHCSEIRAPIPDEFNAQSLEAFWTQTTSGFVSSSDGPSEPVLLLNSMPAGTLPSSAKGNYQTVSGDFDIWARVKTDVGSVGNVRHALIGARRPSDGLGCYVGIRDNGSTGELIRLDEYAVSTLDTTSGLIAAPATAYFVRLKRTGSRFQTFFKGTLDPPVLDSDWIEIANDPATSFAGTEDLRVGSWGYTNNSSAGSALWHFLRNWSGQGNPGESPGNRSAFTWGVSIDNPNLLTVGIHSLPVFICPDGLEVTITKSKIQWGIFDGSHTNGTQVTFEFQVRRAADGWVGIINGLGPIALNDTNNLPLKVYTNDMSDVVLAPNDWIMPYVASRTGTLSERLITLVLTGTQKLQ